MSTDSLLRHLETFTLEGSDEAAIGNPRTLWVTDDRILVADMFFHRILLFDRSGHLQTYLGGEGSAPWEFRHLGPITVSDKWILAQDLRTDLVSVFQRGTGEFVNQFRFPAWFATGWAIAPDTFLLGLQDKKAGTTMALFSVTDGGLRQFGELPEFYREFSIYSTAFHTVSVAPTPSGDVLWGVGGLNELFVSPMTSDSIGEAVDTVRLPVRRRHGVPEDLRDWVYEVGNAHEWFLSVSGLFRLFPIPNGWAALHYDQEVQGRGRISSVYLTTFDYTLQHACVDMLVRKSDAGLPRYYVRADTLFGLDLVLDDSPEMVSAEFSTWLLPDVSTCPQV